MINVRNICVCFSKIRLPTHVLGTRFVGDQPPSPRRLTDMQKRILVWSGKYPSIAQVPDQVSSATMQKARDKFRWRVAVIGMILSVFASFGYAISGKRAAARGDTVGKRYIEWHEELQPGSTKPVR